jgi:hypothetical protein
MAKRKNNLISYINNKQCYGIIDNKIEEIELKKINIKKTANKDISINYDILQQIKNDNLKLKKEVQINEDLIATSKDVLKSKLKNEYINNKTNSNDGLIDIEDFKKNIELKFDIDEICFVLYNNKIKEIKIREIEFKIIIINETERKIIKKYTSILDDNESSIVIAQTILDKNKSRRLEFNENEIFKTIDGLLESL